MGNPFVAVNEWMICCKKKPESRSFCDDTGVQIFATKRLQRLSNRRLQTGAITNPIRASRLFDDAPVQLEDFGDREILHYASRS